MERLELIPIKCTKRFGKFSLSEVVWKELRANGISLHGGDVLVVSSKFAAMSEGRVVKLGEVTPNKRAAALAERYEMDPALAQLVLNESEEIFGGIPGFVLGLTNGSLAPNAGIDKSNVPKGYAILYPRKPAKTAAKLRAKLLGRPVGSKGGIKDLGIILSDSRITPTRVGTVGVALAVAGMKSTVDSRGKKDLFGNELKVTIRAVADQIATAAQLLMGESSESTPIVLVRGLHCVFESARNQMEESLTIPQERCLIVQGLRNVWDRRPPRLSKPRR
jgi:coenzyme F420-0:L-glutamate ligase / coenzyme F420-1:gamma-L-glutamate ligase